MREVRTLLPYRNQPTIEIQANPTELSHFQLMHRLKKMVFVMTLFPVVLNFFSFYNRCRWHQQCSLSCKYLCEFLKKIKMALMCNQGPGRDYLWKSLKWKFSWNSPFNQFFHTWHQCFLYLIPHRWSIISLRVDIVEEGITVSVLSAL